MEIIQSCQYNFCFELPSIILQKRTIKFRNIYIEYLAITMSVGLYLLTVMHKLFANVRPGICLSLVWTCYTYYY